MDNNPTDPAVDPNVGDPTGSGAPTDAPAAPTDQPVADPTTPVAGDATPAPVTPEPDTSGGGDTTGTV